MDKSTKQHLDEWKNYKNSLEFQIKIESDYQNKQWYQYRLDSVNRLISKFD